MPPKRTTVSLAEKKSNILKFFQQEHSVYNMKELEKLIPKKCSGVSSMLVKELVQQIIDEDGIISVEKCGNINIYWCFKNQITMKLSQEIESMRQRLLNSKTEISQLQHEFDHLKVGNRCEFFYHEGEKLERAALLHRIDQLDAQIRKVKSSYDVISESRWNQAKINAKAQEVSRQIEKLNIITDNIEIVTSYLCRKFMIDRKSLRTELEIPEEFPEFEDVCKMLP